MNHNHEVTKCAGENGQCPFYLERGHGRIMLCQHPFWNGKPQGLNGIIAAVHRQPGKFPAECPLRQEPLVVTYTVNPA